MPDASPSDLESAAPEPRPFVIVGVGASSGGLEAFTRLLEHLPTDTDMAFVLVQHLDPQHDSILAELLGHVTAMPVREVTDRMKVEPNRVYVIPPGKHMNIADGVLRLQPRPVGGTPPQSVDLFFEALAHDRRERAIGVILSGAATDGTQGLAAIKGEGGITFAQDESARFGSMPRSAIAAGCVDFELSPEGIAAELARIAAHPHMTGDVSRADPEGDRASAIAHEDDATPLPSGGPGTPITGAKQVRAESEEGESSGLEDSGYRKILQLIRNHAGVDFSFYKSATIRRRISRRIVLSRLETVDAYAAFLQGNARELDALYSDLLISVTSFFRNPEAFDLLQRKVFPQLLAQRGDAPVRIWVLGCSTGQEAYSLAMAFLEVASREDHARGLQVFATDLNEALLEKARSGLYAKSLAQDISPERLRRFFIEEEGGYRISKHLRDSVVFARQNVLSDPPFSRMDLVSCRNLLIYIEPELQKKTLPMFHYALNPEGVLFLGASESVGGYTMLFEQIDKRHKLFRKRPGTTPLQHFPASRGRHATERPPTSSRITASTRSSLPPELSAQREADRVTVHQFAPPGVLINAALQIIQFRGPTSSYLEPPIGNASFDVLRMARDGLRMPLRAAINRAKKAGEPICKKHVEVKHLDGVRPVTLHVIPLKNLKETSFLVLFDEEDSKRQPAENRLSAEPSSLVQTKAPSAAKRKEYSQRIRMLEDELRDHRDYLQSMQEQNETAHEELQASNEECTSANEELQSINEELETSKEELESSNEELTTVNEELASRNTQLNCLNADLGNLHVSINTAILVLNRDLTIRRFTSQAEKTFNLLSSDIGRPLRSVRHTLLSAPSSRDPFESTASASQPLDLEVMVREVVDTVSMIESEVRDRDGRWYSLRMRPYVNLDKKIDGAVLVLVDIDGLKRAEFAAKAARDYAEAIIRTARNPLIVLRADLRVNSANAAFYKMFQTTPDLTEGHQLFEQGSGQWDVPEIRKRLEGVLPRNSAFDDLQIEREFPAVGQRTLLLSARRLDHDSGASPLILLAIEDVSERRRGEAAAAALAAIVDSSDDAIIGEDLAGLIISWNRSAERLYGYSSRAAIGQPAAMLVPADRKHEEAEMWDRARRDEHVRQFETIHLHRNGERLDVAVTSSLTRNSAGEAIGISKIVRDISFQKAAAERLRFSEMRYRTLFNSMDQGYCVIEVLFDANDQPVDYRFEEVNPSFEKQTGLVAVTGKRMRELAPDHEKHWFEIYGKVARTGEPIRFANEAKALNRWFDVYAFRLGTSVQPRVAVLFNDITASRGAAAELAEARDKAVNVSRAKDEFLAALSHELRTPLNPALLIASEAAENHDLPEQVRADFDAVRKSIELEARLIDDLLDLTRIASGKLKIEMQTCEVHAVLRDAIAVVRGDITEKRLELAEALTAAETTMTGDPVRLEQIFWNILRNAVHFTPRDGRITVASQTRGDELTITISDTGAGILPADLERIFETFAQGKHEGGERRFGGLGLGLAISRKLVELHGGSIEAYSPGRGHGSSFLIRLPLLPDSRAGTERAPASPPERSRGAGHSASERALQQEKGSVLVVEDHDSTRKALHRLLSSRRYSVHSAGSVEAALAVARQDRIDIIVSDLGLPDGDGYSLMKRIKTLQPNIRGIALSGFGTEGDIVKSKQAGFDLHLIKPISIASLDEALGKLILAGDDGHSAPGS